MSINVINLVSCKNPDSDSVAYWGSRDSAFLSGSRVEPMLLVSDQTLSGEGLGVRVRRGEAHGLSCAAPEMRQV